MKMETDVVVCELVMIIYLFRSTKLFVQQQKLLNHTCDQLCFSSFKSQMQILFSENVL